MSMEKLEKAFAITARHSSVGGDVRETLAVLRSLPQEEDTPRLAPPLPVFRRWSQSPII